MHPRVKQLYDLILEIRDDETIPVEDAFIMIGVLKVGQTILMMKGNKPLFPEERKKK